MSCAVLFDWFVLSLELKCGRRAKERLVTRIIGAETGSRGKWPWYVVVRTEHHKRNQKVKIIDCGGVILSRKFILTAAHCVCKFPYLIK